MISNQIIAKVNGIAYGICMTVDRPICRMLSKNGLNVFRHSCIKHKLTSQKFG